MDGKDQGRNGGKISMSETRISNGGRVVMMPISSGEISRSLSSKDLENFGPRQHKPNSPLKESRTGNEFANAVSMSRPSPEISRLSPSPNRPPKYPRTSENLTKRRSFSRSVYSKSKSRFEEQPCPVDDDDALFEENSLTLQEQTAMTSPYRDSLNRESPNNNSASSVRTNSITPKTPLMASVGGPANEEKEEEGEADEEEEEIDNTVKLSEEKKHRRVRSKVVIQWLAFGFISGCLVASLTVEKLETTLVWGLEIWKWCVLVLVMFCGMLVTNWFMNLIVFLIEKNFLLRKKVLYFVHGLKKSIQVFIWIALVLIAWTLLFHHGVEWTKTSTRILNGVSWTLISLLIGSFLWLLKTLLLKILASKFHVNRFFDRIQDSVFHQYVVQTLSGPALIEEAQKVGRSASSGQLSFRINRKGKGKKEKKVIDMAKVHKMKREKVSAWNMKVLVDGITNSGLSTISDALDQSVQDGGGEITSEMKARAAGYRIFKNVTRGLHKYIDEDDLSRFMIKEEVDLVFPLFEGHETGRISRKSLIGWVVKVYKDRKALAYSVNDTKTAVKQLNNLVGVIIITVTFVIWLVLVQIATTEVLVFLSSQLVLAAFMFGNTCKTIFEAIIFIFVMHPFDVGDRCVIDGVQLLVEEMNILTTVFLKLDQEKVYYPNSVLAAKAISNYFRSPNMGDNVEFSIDFATSAQKIALLKDNIKQYLENNPQHYQTLHSVVVKEIENVNKLKMALYFNHTITFQEYAERLRRRTELAMEIKRIIEELGIKYYLLPQGIHLRQVGSESTDPTSR